MADTMPGMSSGTSDSIDKGNVPPEVEKTLDILLADVRPGQGTPARDALQPLLDFVESDVRPEKVRPHKRSHGEGAFSRATLHLPLQRVLRYCYDPEIPGEALYPNVLRRSYWLPESDILTQKVELWNILDGLTDDSPPVVLRGAEYEEITPDSFSGCYYSYTLDRLLVLMRHKGRGTLISVTRQRDPSNVGRVGAIVGKDSDWNYVYSQVVGSNIKLASWAETYMYDSANITVFYEPTPGAQITQIAFFKYLKAGWANMNMVKPAHITTGSQRFLEGLRQVLESPRLPGAETIAAEAKNFRSMDQVSLRAALTPYSARLEVHARSGPLSSANFKKLLANKGYAETLNTQEMVSELIKQFIKNKLGKPVLPPEVASR